MVPPLTPYHCRHCKTPFPVSRLRSREAWSAREGLPVPLGASWIPEEQSFNFALFAKHADEVELLFFAEDRLTEPAIRFRFDPLKNKSGPVWHCRIPGEQLFEVKYYGYQIAGPNAGPGFEFHTYDAEKLLLDPYARSIYFPPEFDRSMAMHRGSNLGRAPLSLLDECQCPFDWDGDRRIRHEGDLVIYELHVRGFTQNANSSVPAARRGTFLGLIDKIPYLNELGVTAVELMPIFQFDPQEGNYWGYMPLSFFAPHHAYSTNPDACAQRSEFREMVKALHAAGIEVILDVVFNHTCEGNEDGPLYHFKGLDNSTYYMVVPGVPPAYANYSGCGNTLHTANRTVRQLVVDSLRYWAEEMHVDGFRFDLASIFTRNSDGSVNLDDPPIFAQIAGDPALQDVRLIAEPWDAGDGYLLGQQFPGVRWMQWNARYRETLQRFVRGDQGLIGELMSRLYGSSDLFPDDRFQALRPFQSINYIASHDGFTLYDLVSYNQKHNEANGHGNTDGPNEFSWNCGIEGDIDVPSEVLELRTRQVKNFFCLLMLSNGTPMFRMGDEFLQTQSGNNNPYKEDSPTSWLDWQRLKAHPELFRFVQGMIAFRKAHPSITRSRFWREDVTWYGSEGAVDWGPTSQTLAYSLDGRREGDCDLYVMINGEDRPRRFEIQHQRATWKQVISTASLPPEDLVSDELAAPQCCGALELGPRSIVVLIS